MKAKLEKQNMELFSILFYFCTVNNLKLRKMNVINRHLFSDEIDESFQNVYKVKVIFLSLMIYFP